MESVLRDKKAILVFLLPSFLLFTLIVIVPIFMSAYYSLHEWSGVGEMKYIGLNNYIKLMQDSIFVNASRNTLMIAIASVFIQLPLSLLLALVLATKVKRPHFFITVYFIPVILSAVVIGQLWMRIYNYDFGLLNLGLRSIGLIDLGNTVWLGDINTVFTAVLVVVLWQYVGYHMLLFYSGIKSISPDIFEAAKIDGASFWRTSLSITIPLLKPIILVSLTFAVVGSMKVYDIVAVMTDGGRPAGVSDVISTVMVRTMFFPSNNYGYGSSMAVMLIVLCISLYFLLAFIFRDKDDTVQRRNKRGRQHQKHRVIN